MRRIVWLCGAAFAACTTVASAAAPLIPIARFAELPKLSKPILSPDGHRIAARSNTNGETTLVILDADQPEKVINRIKIGKTTVADLNWAGNARLLLQILSRDKLPGGDEIPFLRLIAIDVDTGASRVVDRRSQGMYAGDVLYTDPMGSWALVAGQDDVFSYPSVKRVDLATGDSKVVEKPRDGVWDWYADDQGIVRAGISYDGDRWTIWYRDKPEDKLHQVHGKFPKDDNSTVDRFIFRGDKSWIVTNERTGRFGLYRYDLKTQTIGDPIFENADADLNDVYYDAMTGDVDAVEYEDDRPHVYWLDADMKALQAKLDKAVPGSVNLPVDWSKDDKKALILSSSATDPGLYYLLDRTSLQMHPVVNP